MKVTMIVMTHLRLGLAAKPDGDHSEDGGGAELGPGGCLLALVSLDQPEGDPGAHHDDVQGNVHLRTEKGRTRSFIYIGKPESKVQSPSPAPSQNGEVHFWTQGFY